MADYRRLWGRKIIETVIEFLTAAAKEWRILAVLQRAGIFETVAYLMRMRVENREDFM
jgi:hypothetical protein